MATAELAVAQGTQLCESDGTITTNAVALAKIDQAISMAGLACATWEGSDWWWLHSTGSFATVASTASYALRTVNTNNMPALWSVDRAYYDDDWALEPVSWGEYQRWYRLERPSADTSKPLKYAITGEAPYMYVWPIPDAAYTINIDYPKRHSKITNADSDDAALIVPAEFQWGIYVLGAEWLIRHETFDPASLRDCPGFVEAINRMKASDPTQRTFDKEMDRFPDTRGAIPWDRRVYITEGGVSLIGGKPTL